METYIDDFITYIRSVRNYSDYTETNYLIDLDNYSDYLLHEKLDFKRVTYKDLVLYVKYLKDDRKLNSTSVNRHLSSLRSFYNYMLVKGILQRELE